MLQTQHNFKGFYRLSRVLPMPLVGLLIIVSVCADVGSQPLEYPELEALFMLDFGAAVRTLPGRATNIRVSINQLSWFMYCCLPSLMFGD